jgi:hypothetical protein
MPQGHVLGVLRVAAGAPAAGVRREAAVLAAAHLATCGALETPAVARREAAAWLLHLPAAPVGAAEAACSFLAEAAVTAARRRGADAAAAATALHAAPAPAPGWPRSNSGGGNIAGEGGSAEDISAADADADAAADAADAVVGVIPSTASGEDLSFSGLCAGAIAASVKVIGSAKRSRLQRLTVAAYISAGAYTLPLFSST